MEQQTESQTSESTTAKGKGGADQYLRILFMIGFWIVLRISDWVVGALMIMQFAYRIPSGEDNQKLLDFGDSLTQYIASIVAYQTYQTEEKPYPFSPWPKPKSAPSSDDAQKDEGELKPST